MQALALPQLRPLGSFAPLVLRVAVGLVMALHGFSKLQSMGAEQGWLTGGMLANIGLPAPVALAWLVMLIELVGGILLIVGLLSRLSAVLIAIVLLVAIITVKSNMGIIAAQGPGAELDIALMGGALAVAFMGPGGLSLDSVLGIEPDAPTV